MSTGPENSWLLNTLIGMAGFLAAVLGGSIVRDRQIFRQIREGEDRLHERINRVREDYVRREDLDNHIQRLETNVKDLRDEVRDMRKEQSLQFRQLLAVASKGGE